MSSRAIGVRVKERDRLMIETAAAIEGESRSSFIANAAAERARRRIREKRGRDHGQTQDRAES